MRVGNGGASPSWVTVSIGRGDGEGSEAVGHLSELFFPQHSSPYLLISELHVRSYGRWGPTLKYIKVFEKQNEDALNPVWEETWVL